jgi:hypothetical protein
MTVAELKEIAASSGIAHARFCLEQEATQVGEDALDDVFAALIKMEQDEFADDDTE